MVLSSCSRQPVEVHRIWKCSRTPDGSRTSRRRERRDSVLRRWRLRHRGIQICETLVRAMFIYVYALVINESICSCPLSLLSCLFQHQPHHWSCGGADAEPHRRDDGGAEGVRSPDTRQYVWEVGEVNIPNKEGLGEQITLLRTSESPRFSLVITRGGGKNPFLNACRRRCGWFATVKDRF